MDDIIERLKRRCRDMSGSVPLVCDMTDAVAEIERLRAALEWYAEQVAGCRKLGSIGDPARRALDADGGKRAREALK